MGTIYILSDRFGFKSLQGIRDAYEAAFYKDSDFIDKFIQQDCLDRLSAFRNVIVHRAAIADAEYVQITRNVTTLPKLEIGEKLRLDAQMVGSLVHETAVVCRFLIYFVDKWLDDNAIKVGEDEQ